MLPVELFAFPIRITKIIGELGAKEMDSLLFSNVVFFSALAVVAYAALFIAGLIDNGV